MTRTVVVTGAGGVGKTTLAAAIGVILARSGLRTLVLTIDPAKRLADALSAGELGDEPQLVLSEPNLYAAMLDVAASWEGIIHRYADPEVADRLLVNPYFRAIADRFPAAQSYAAGERMAEYIESGRYGAIVIDTPPSSGGMDFFLAPASTGELVSGKLLRWLTGSRLPGRSVLFQFTAKPMLRLADGVLGGPMLSDVADFLLDLRTIYDRLAVRSKAIERHLRAADTIIVTTADPTPIYETTRFFEELAGIKITPEAILFNRMLPESWIEEADRRASATDSSDPTAAVLTNNLVAWSAEARRQIEAARELSARYRLPVHEIGWRVPPPSTLDELASLLSAVDVSNGFANIPTSQQ
ncbi:MAG: AAA family ATPase [Actinomycetota bacterium]|nr:AAA family ATPase [Actinomycetota bacterium]